MIKQKLNQQKAEKVALSLQKLYIMAKVLCMESVNELDVNFKMPVINSFAKRIQGDCESINKHLERSGYYELAHLDTTEDYAGEIWRVLDLVIGLDASNIKEFADYLENEFKTMQA